MEMQKDLATHPQSQAELTEPEYRPSVMEIIKTGKVRNIHAFTGLVFETSNRLSVFDRVIKEEVPLKGAMLNCISQCNKQVLNGCGFITDYIPVPASFYTSAGFDAKDVGRLSYSQALTMLPFEFIVRGYLVGSAYKAYKKGESYCGFTFPEGLKEGEKLPEPIVTPTTKEENGHDRAVTKEECIELLTYWLLDNDMIMDPEEISDIYAGDLQAFRDDMADILTSEAIQFGETSGEDEWEQIEYALAYICAQDYVEQAYEDSLDAYGVLSAKCDDVGILFIDTKFEFGLNDNDDLVLADEVGTPDSSRFASAEVYADTGKIVSYDKQIVRDYCTSIGFTGDADQPTPEVPDEIWEKVTQTYVYVAELLCGKEAVAEYK